MNYKKLFLKINSGKIKIMFLIFVLSIFISSDVLSQIKTFYITGQVTDKSCGKPVKGQIINIASDSSSNPDDNYFLKVRTNEKGIYFATINEFPDNSNLIIYTIDVYNNTLDTVINIGDISFSNNHINVNFELYSSIISSGCEPDFCFIFDSISSKPYLYHFIDNSGENTISWFWDFGDGTSSTEQNPSHQFKEMSVYYISLTISTINPSGTGCTGTITKKLNIGMRSYFNFGGHAFADLFPIDLGTAYLYKIDSTNIIPVDTAIIDTLGFYYFYQIPEGNYITKVCIHTNSPYSELFLPTYYGDEQFWADADIIILNSNNWEYDIHMIQLNVSVNTGEGVINGKVTYGEYDNKDEPASNIEIILIDELDNCLFYIYSDEEGYFSFNELEYGIYKIYPEVTGVDAVPISVDINETNPIIENINIVIQANGISYSINDNYSEYIDNIGKVYPNPATDLVNIEIYFKKTSIIQISVYNQLGMLVYRSSESKSMGKHIILIKLEHLSKGFYNIQISTIDNVSFIRKLIKVD